MLKKTRAKLIFLLKSILFWMGAFALYFVARNLGLEDEPGIIVQDPITGFESLYFIVRMGVVTGLFYGIIEIFSDFQFLLRKPLGVRLLYKVVAYFILINILIQVALDILSSVVSVPLDMTRAELMLSGAVWSFIIYFIVCSSLFSFFRMVNEKFGPGVLWNMILGKYRSPRVEKKIFMFLDLKSSTAIAEQLGYRKYSLLIQESFYDLNEIVPDFEGEIYQYVGDEAVICWDYEKGIKDHICIDFYFAFRDKIYSRKDYYQEHFGLVPEFKAGLHGGELMVTEVGVVKKEIAYHGDVINTTARIQEKCNEFGELLLVSDVLQTSATSDSRYTFDSQGDISLKGKAVPVQLHSVAIRSGIPEN